MLLIQRKINVYTTCFLIITHDRNHWHILAMGKAHFPWRCAIFLLYLSNEYRLMSQHDNFLTFIWCYHIQSWFDVTQILDQFFALTKYVASRTPLVFKALALLWFFLVTEIYISYFLPPISLNIMLLFSGEIKFGFYFKAFHIDAQY